MFLNLLVMYILNYINENYPKFYYLKYKLRYSYLIYLSD